MLYSGRSKLYLKLRWMPSHTVGHLMIGQHMHSCLTQLAPKKVYTSCSKGSSSSPQRELPTLIVSRARWRNLSQLYSPPFVRVKQPLISYPIGRNIYAAPQWAILEVEPLARRVFSVPAGGRQGL